MATGVRVEQLEHVHATLLVVESRTLNVRRWIFAIYLSNERESDYEKDEADHGQENRFVFPQNVWPFVYYGRHEAFHITKLPITINP